MSQIGNYIILWLLGSPVHRMLSEKVVGVTYEGRRSGARVKLPVQYAIQGDQIVVFPGHPATKRWWRNFEQPHDATLLLEGRSVRSVGVVVRDAVSLAPFTDAYEQRFPKARDVELLVVFTQSRV